MMMLELDDILQLDATMIAGILIVLTIMSSKTSKSKPKNFLWSLWTKEQRVASVVIPFALSAIIILWKSVQYPQIDSHLTGIDVVFPIVGFFYLILIAVYFVKLSKTETNS